MVQQTSNCRIHTVMNNLKYIIFDTWLRRFLGFWIDTDFCNWSI